MLKQLTLIIKETEGNITLSQLSQELGASPSAVAGMLETLMRKGRVVEFDSDCGICETCTLHPECALPAKRARRFRVI